MILPEGDHAAQEFRAAEQGTIGCGGAADDDVIAAAGGGVATVLGEFLRGEAVGFGFGGNGFVYLFEFVPISGGWKIDFDDTGVGCNAEGLQTGIGGRRVAFEPDGLFEMSAGVFDSGDEIEIVSASLGA